MEIRKILCLAPYRFLPAKMGGQKAIDSFYRLLSKQWEIVCFSTKNNDASVAIPYRLKRILADSPIRYINIFFLLKWIKLIKKERPDLLEMEQPYFGWMMIAAKKIAAKPLLVRSHNIEGLRFKTIGKWWWKIMWYYEKWVYKNADFIFFITEEDRTYAIEKMKIQAEKSYTISYSVALTSAPPVSIKNNARKKLLERHALKENDQLLLFNGAFDYLPNLEALYALIKHFKRISTEGENYKLIICGKDIPEDLIKEEENASIIFAGFVFDISVYFLGADVFLNPIVTGGGIKTKLVEALANNLSSVSFSNGAIGVDPAWCNGKLMVVENNNWRLFFDSIPLAINTRTSINESFFDEFSADKQLEKIKNIL